MNTTTPAHELGRETEMAHYAPATSATGSLIFSRGEIGGIREVDQLPIDSVQDIELVRTLAGMRALEADWRGLEDDAAANFNFFQSFDWNLRWANRFVSGQGGSTPVILTGRDRGRLVMLWPLMIERVGPLRVLKWLGDPFPQYGGVLIADGIDPSVWLDRAWRRLVETTGVDAIVLRRVRSDDPAAGMLSEAADHKVSQGLDCFIDIGEFSSHEQLMNSLPSRRRLLRRKLRRNLGAMGTLGYRTYFGGPKFDFIIRRTLQLKRQWLRETGQISRAIADSRIDELLMSFGRDGPNQGQVGAGMLTVGGKVASYEIAFHYRGRHYLYVIAQEPEFAALSPSKVQVDEAQAWGVANGVEVFDLLPPEDRYKLDLSDQTIETFDCFKALSLQGRIWVTYLHKLRPALKAGYLRYGAGLAVRFRRWRLALRTH